MFNNSYIKIIFHKMRWLKLISFLTHDIGLALESSNYLVAYKLIQFSKTLVTFITFKNSKSTNQAKINNIKQMNILRIKYSVFTVLSVKLKCRNFNNAYKYNFLKRILKFGID